MRNVRNVHERCVPGIAFCDCENCLKIIIVRNYDCQSMNQTEELIFSQNLVSSFSHQSLKPSEPFLKYSHNENKHSSKPYSQNSTTNWAQFIILFNILFNIFTEFRLPIFVFHSKIIFHWIQKPRESIYWAVFFVKGKVNWMEGKGLSFWVIPLNRNRTEQWQKVSIFNVETLQSHSNHTLYTYICLCLSKWV